MLADASSLLEGTDSSIIGATSLMFHDRLATLEKFLKSHPHLSPVDLNLNLFLASQPPSDLEFNQAAFIWWTSVDISFRRHAQTLHEDAPNHSLKNVHHSM
jgi:hypothetical protein